MLRQYNRLITTLHVKRNGRGGKSHLLHVNATGKEVGGDEDTRGSRAELTHDDITGVLVHVSVSGAHGVVALTHLVSQPVHLCPINAIQDTYLNCLRMQSLMSKSSDVQLQQPTGPSCTTITSSLEQRYCARPVSFLTDLARKKEG